MARFLGAIVAICFGSAVQAQAPAPSVEDYAAMTNMSSVRLSPNGERVVFISGETRAERNIIIYSLVGEGSHVIDGGDDQVLVNVSWLNDDHISATYSERRDIIAAGERADVFRNYVVDYDGSDNWELNNYATIANRDLSDPDSILVWLPVLQDNRGSPAAGGGVDQAVGLYRQGLDRDRNRDRVFIGEGGFNYILNAENEPIVRYTSDGGEFELWSRRSGRWQRVYAENLERERFRFGARRSDRWTGRMTNMAGLDITGRYGYFTSRVNDDRMAVFRFDFETNEIEGPVLQSELADVGNFITDWRTNAIIGVRWNEEREKVHYFDPDFAALQEQLEGFFPSSNVTITSWDTDFRKVIVNIEGGSTAGAYYLLNRETGDVTLLAQSRPRIPDEVVAEVQVVQYEARDGLDLFGYLTLPPGREAQDLPLIMLPHGGPQARDFYGFDPWAQFLASRGYAVFQPQFRGSEGFGRDFITMAHGEWGRSMQDDISDAVHHLVESGVAAQDRVCIFGWSYGGYAALAGATLTPELYRCVVAGAPVSDVFAMMDYVTGRFGGASVTYWAEYIGDWRSETDYITRISPARQVEHVQAPLMLIHGTDDLIVPYEQAELMAQAMDRVGKPYELVRIEDGPHQSYRMTVANMEQLYSNLERFLLEHNPPD
ncbi:S9 family peptidase [Maricaulis sp.]|uniref:alpha/beta hydrolase family protein n=1 Tax=Maricaulis sp. TaxID=1486257 RepID=UPI001B0ED87B|nr:S9 family peptidase [Maricaulis sp.]MBO6763991.1 S9 family peptidase [Maricaulis sp.]